MGTIFSTLIDYMEAEQWRYEILEGQTVLRFHVKTKSGRLMCYAEVQEDKYWLLFYSYLPVNVPEDRMTRVAEFLTRANQGMRIGNFELDFADGEVRYKTSIDMEGGEITHKMIDNLLQANLSTMDRYFNGMMEVVYGSKLPVELIAGIESPDNDEDDDDEDDDEFAIDDELDDDDDDIPMDLNEEDDEEEDFRS